jgi:hypothetical protein
MRNAIADCSAVRTHAVASAKGVGVDKSKACRVPSEARDLKEADHRMKPISNSGWTLLATVIIAAFYLLNRGILIGSTVENIGHVSGTTQPIYRATCRYLSLNGIGPRIEPPQLSEDFHCPLFK